MPVSQATPSNTWRRFDWYDVSPVRAPKSALLPPAPKSALLPPAPSNTPPNQANGSSPGAAGAKEVACVIVTTLRPALDAVVHPTSAADACSAAAAAHEAGVASDESFNPHAPPLVAAAASWPARAALGARGMVIAAYATGRVALLVPGTYEEILSFSAFGPGGRVTHLSTDADGRLVALGEELGVRFPLIRIWDLRQIFAQVTNTEDSDEDDEDEAPLRPGDARAVPRHQTIRAILSPRLLAEARVQHGSRPTPAAALAHTPDLAFLSVGLADGTVLLLRGLSDALASVSTKPGAPTDQRSGMAADKSSAQDESDASIPLVSLPKFKVVLQQPSRSTEPPLEPLTALALSVVRDPDTVVANGTSRTEGKSSVTDTNSKPYVARDKHRKAKSSSNAATTDTMVYLYIVTPTKLLRYLVQAPAGASYGRPTIVDDVGTALGCVALLPCTLNALALLPSSGDPRNLIPSRAGLSQEKASSSAAAEIVLRDTARAWRSRMGLAGKLVLARDEALYIAGGEGREACYALEGSKVAALLTCDANVLYRITDSNPAGAAAATHHLVVWGPPKGPAGQESALLSVFDLEAQAVAASYRVPGGVRAVWIESAAEVAAGEVRIGVLSNAGHVLRLTQRTLSVRTEALVRLALTPSTPSSSSSLGLRAEDASQGAGGEFAVALSTTRAYLLSLLQGGAGPWGVGDRSSASLHDQRSAHATLVRALGAAVPRVASLHAQYADALAARSEFDAATAQWVKAVGAVRPSHVIRTLLDSQRISHLATYLAALHSQGLATPEHTTLLLNCYAKLKDVAALDAFIREPARAAARAARAAKRDQGSKNGHGSKASLRAGVPERGEVQEMDQEDDPSRIAGAAGQSDARAREREALPFDLATAIRVCRQGGFYTQAGYLAARYGDANEYMRIQVGDLEDWNAALVYVRRSSPFQAQRLLESHARVLLRHRPMPTTTLLVELCAGQFTPGSLPFDVNPAPEPDDTNDDLDQSVATLDQSKVEPESQTRRLMSYLQLTSYLRSRTTKEGSEPSTSSTHAAPVSAEPAPPSPEHRNGPIVSTYPPPSPQMFFAHFAGMHEEFALFLESVALLRWGQQVDMVSDPIDHVPSDASLAPEPLETPDAQAQQAVWNTLLELFLAQPTSPPANKPNDSSAPPPSPLGLNPTGTRARALRLLEQYATLPYDVTHALLLCTSANFTPGLIFLYARLGLYDDLAHLFLRLSTSPDSDPAQADEAHGQLNEVLAKWGDKAPHLYPLVLKHLVSSPALLSRRSDDVANFLTVVEQRNLLSPAEVVQLLAGPEADDGSEASGGAGIGLVRAYLVRSLTASHDAAAADSALLRSYLAKTRSKEQAAVSLTSADSPAVLQATTCSACSQSLSLPSTHFLCKHAYHSSCLAAASSGRESGATEELEDGEPQATECPLCAQSATLNAQIRKANVKAARNPQVLLDQIAHADDGLAATARLFGMGLLGLEPPTA